MIVLDLPHASNCLGSGSAHKRACTYRQGRSRENVYSVSVTRFAYLATYRQGSSSRYWSAGPSFPDE